MGYVMVQPILQIHTLDLHGLPVCFHVRHVRGQGAYLAVGHRFLYVRQVFHARVHFCN